MTPLISLVLCVKNGMPYLHEALKSVESQDYKNYELIVQDCVSTDDTLAELKAFSHLPIHIVSERDGGIGDAYDKALARCQGDIIGSIDSDNLLMPDALKTVAEKFVEEPELAVLYSAVQMITHDGTLAHTFEPIDFELEKVLSAELVPPFSTSFFSSKHCGDKLRFDKTLKTCADFDLWLSLSSLKIKCIEPILGATRMSEKSMTCNPDAYIQFCDDKIFAFDRFLANNKHLTQLTADQNKFKAGIFIWAAESIFYMENLSERTMHLYNLAKELDDSDTSRTRYFENNFMN